MKRSPKKARSLSAEDERLIAEFKVYLAVERGLAAATVSSYESDIRQVLGLAGRPAVNLTLNDLTRVLGDLGSAGRRVASLNRMTTALKVFYRFLVGEGHITKSPLEYLGGARPGERLPDYLFYEDVEAIISAAAAELASAEKAYTAGGRAPARARQLFRAARDVAMLALAYASGLRASELAGLKLGSLDRRLSFVRLVGKGSKERLVPYGQVAAGYLGRYIDEYKMLSGVESPYVFTSWKAREPVTRQALWYIVKKYARVAGVSGVKPHTFRHTFATHLIQAGADIRTVQELLGHASIGTTQIYTQLDVARLREIHRAAHPRK